MTKDRQMTAALAALHNKRSPFAGGSFYYHYNFALFADEVVQLIQFRRKHNLYTPVF
jgi:hypothetical protein